MTITLRPYTAYRDSGIPWLGEIPAHWEIDPLKRAMDFREGPGIMATESPGPTPACRKATASDASPKTWSSPSTNNA